jgi:hypothetical protein
VLRTVNEKRKGYACLDGLVKDLQVKSSSVQVADVAKVARAIRAFMSRTKLGVMDTDEVIEKVYPWKELLKTEANTSTLPDPVDAIGKIITQLEDELATVDDVETAEGKVELAQRIVMYKDAKNTFQLLKNKKFDKITEPAIETVKSLFGDEQGQRLENLVSMVKSAFTQDPNSGEVGGVDEDGRPIISSIHWLNEGGYSGWMKLEFADCDDQTENISTTKTLDKVTTSDGISERALNCAIHVTIADLERLGLKQGQIFRSTVNVRAGKDSNWSPWYRFDQDSKLSVGYVTNETVFTVPTPNPAPIGSFADVKKTFANTQGNVLKLVGTIIGATIASSLAAGAIASASMGLSTRSFWCNRCSLDHSFWIGLRNCLRTCLVLAQDDPQRRESYRC